MNKYDDFLERYRKSRKRLEAWWNGGVLDRVILFIQVPKKEVPPPLPEKKGVPEEIALDVEYRLDCFEHYLASTDFLGEAFPHFGAGLGTGDLALYLGASVRFSPREGVWYEPCLKDAETVPELKLDPKNKWWRSTLQMIDAALARAKGRYLVSIPTIGYNLDVLASLRGTNNLLLDLIERPRFVHGCQRQIVDVGKDCYDQVY